MGRLSSSFQAKHPKKFFFPAWTPFVFCYSWSIFFWVQKDSSAHPKFWIQKHVSPCLVNHRGNTKRSNPCRSGLGKPPDHPGARAWSKSLGSLGSLGDVDGEAMHGGIFMG
jgi:hypothetical protein